MSQWCFTSQLKHSNTSPHTCINKTLTRMRTKCLWTVYTKPNPWHVMIKIIMIIIKWHYNNKGTFSPQKHSPNSLSISQKFSIVFLVRKWTGLGPISWFILIPIITCSWQTLGGLLPAGQIMWNCPHLALAGGKKKV